MAQRRSQDNIRIIVFGGSAAMGDPQPAFGFPRFLEVALESRYPGKKVEVVNAAMTAINSHVVLAIAKELQQLDADAWLVYMGNNEFVGPFAPTRQFDLRPLPRPLVKGHIALTSTRTGQWMQGLLENRNKGDAPQKW